MINRGLSDKICSVFILLDQIIAAFKYSYRSKFTSITIAWRVQPFSPGVRDERSKVAVMFLSDRSFDLYFAIDYSSSYKCKF